MSTAVLLLFGQPYASFIHVEPGVFAERCPVIVSGEVIRSADTTFPGCPPADTALIRIERVYKNLLIDVELEENQLLAVYMAPIRKVREDLICELSTDIRYPVGTQGIWFVLLTSGDRFSVAAHPVQLG